MTIHRFFINPDLITEKIITLPEEISHQITQVLRLKSEAKIILLDNTGFEYLVKLIDVNKKHTIAELIEKKENKNEPDVKVHLFMALIARDNFELVLQKSVELGVTEITPIITERTQFDKKFAEAKYERWNKIIKESSEQSERAILPILNNPINFESAIIEATQKGESYIAWEKETSGTLNRHAELVSASHTINIFIGPEGGFTEQEIEFAKQNDVKPISLGKTILRAETAAIALIAKIMI